MYPDDDNDTCLTCENYEACLLGDIYMCPYDVEP